MSDLYVKVLDLYCYVLDLYFRMLDVYFKAFDLYFKVLHSHLSKPQSSQQTLVISANLCHLRIPLQSGESRPREV